MQTIQQLRFKRIEFLWLKEKEKTKASKLISISNFLYFKFYQHLIFYASYLAYIYTYLAPYLGTFYCNNVIKSLCNFFFLIFLTFIIVNVRINSTNSFKISNLIIWCLQFQFHRVLHFPPHPNILIMTYTICLAGNQKEFLCSCVLVIVRIWGYFLFDILTKVMNIKHRV